MVIDDSQEQTYEESNRRPTNLLRVRRQRESEQLEQRVEIPEGEDESWFSFRKLWTFTGPGWLMSIAYLDPGNIESDLQGGVTARYRLIWVLLFSHIIGLLLQRLSARLGVVSGRHMAEMAYEFYPKVPRLILWVGIEIAIIGSDMQEVLGTSIAIFIISQGYIPLWGGCLITILDTFTFLFIDNYGVRRLEFFFAFLITVMATSFGYEYFRDIPEQKDMAEGFIPFIHSYNREAIIQGIGIVGAVIMPHNLYLHSALVKSRRIIRTVKSRVSEANFYYFIESGLALLVSFLINLFVMTVFAHGLNGKTNNQIRLECEKNNFIVPEVDLVFPRNNETVDGTLYVGGMFLACTFGPAALYIWSFGILAAGQSSTMTGTYAGQYVMESFLNITWPKWKRVLVTRSIAIVPTLIVAFAADGVHNMTNMNDYLNCLQMICLPFALIPIITFTAHPQIMFDFKNSKPFNILASILSFSAIAINLWFFEDLVFRKFGYEWYVIFLFTFGAIFYIGFLSYLTLIACISMGLFKSNYLNTILKYETLENEYAAWKEEIHDETIEGGRENAVFESTQ
uniref:Protein Malvolio n=1 Tax=Rhabditophanes sp. KR3021 TaxID=114890 RepID=A0AC35U027_9BILA